ncbi:MAG: thioredoxin family protein [Rhodocyclaceae bacterium]
MVEAASCGFSVVCLCADWCGTCRDYRAQFDALAVEFADGRFVWFDIEDDAEHVGHIDVETFPTLLIERAGHVVYLGAVLPDPGHARRLIASFAGMTGEEAERYAQANAERAEWQSVMPTLEPETREG